MAIFSDVASACISTTTASATSPRGQALSSASTEAENGSSRASMCTAPSRLITSTHDGRTRRARTAERLAARASRHGRVVERADQPGFAHDIGQRLALVPGVIAERQAVGAGLEQFAGGVFADAEAAGGVLGVDGDEIQPESAAKVGQVIGNAGAAGAADDVAEESKAHGSRVLSNVDIGLFGQDRVQSLIMGFERDRRHFLAGVGQAEHEHRSPRPKRRDGAVIVTAALADAAACPVEGEQRGDDEVGLVLGRRVRSVGDWILKASGASRSPSA